MKPETLTEPVDGIHGALEDGQESKDDPVGQPLYKSVCALFPYCVHDAYLSVVDFAGAEERIQRVVARNDETGNVDEELAGNVEEDEEEVQAGETENSIDLGDGGLLLEVVEGGVFGQIINETPHLG